MKMEKFLAGSKNKRQYKILGVVGSGGFGEVYKATDTINNRIVAIKIFQTKLDQDQSKLDWEREARQALSIKGSHVIESYELQSSNGQFYLVMEFAESGSLRNFIDKLSNEAELPDEPIVVNLFKQMLQGIQTIHKTTLHRDIKPENMLFVGDNLKISDFGLAKYIDESTRTRTYKGWGTYKYMAPESWTLSKVTQATDIYSLGIVLFELATRQLPFSSADVKELEELHRFGNRPHAQTINPKISSRLDGIIYKMMKQSPNDRYGSAEELLGELDGSVVDISTDQLNPIVEIARKIQDTETQKELTNMKKLEEEAKRRKMNKVKIVELAEKLSKVVDEFNNNMPEEKITLSMGNETDYTLIWRKVDLLNLSINPEIHIGNLVIGDNKIVVHANMSFRVSSNQDEGINFILCAEDDEDYGTWKVLEVHHHALVNRPQHPLIADWQILSRLAKFENAMDVYTKTIRDDVELEFRSIIQKAFEYYENQRLKENTPRENFDDW